MFAGVAVAISTLCLVCSVSGSGFDGFTGDYCATRTDACCNGRIDDCSVPVYGTRCYCDEFCNRTRDDCCPDYWNVCHGVPLPPEPISRCYAGDRYYYYGEEVKINCNKCKCENIGLRAELICERKTCLLEENLINSINSDESLGWRAANYSAFWGRPLSDGITFRTGTLEPHRSVKNMQPVLIKQSQALPQFFDSRTRWPGLIGDPLDQGWCGASWVMSTIDVAGDRQAIMSGGLDKVRLAGQHLLSCGNRGQQGCQGGHLSRAWWYMRKSGQTTFTNQCKLCSDVCQCLNINYNNTSMKTAADRESNKMPISLVNEECYPWAQGITSRCRLPKKANLCTARCKPPANSQSFRTELYKVGPAYRIKGEEDIMQEIMSSGPVQATMKVYQDFFSYKSGVYHKSFKGEDNDFAYHSVRIIGWGEESDRLGRRIKYWLAVNSWGPYWGENGFFKIVRGTNECEIEDFVLAVWSETPKTSSQGPCRNS